MPPPSMSHVWKRADQPPWEARWNALPLQARQAFLNDVSLPVAYSNHVDTTPLAKLFSVIVEVLLEAGFLERQGPKGVVVAPRARPFAARLHALGQCKLLDDVEAGTSVYSFLHQSFGHYQVVQTLTEVVQHATKIRQYRLDGDIVNQFVLRRFWPDWVAAFSKDPLAAPLLTALEQAEQPVLLARVGDLLPKHKPGDVRATVDQLVTRLALVEGLDKETLEIRVGLIPRVARLRRQNQQRPAMQLQPVVAKDVGPDAGTGLPDLRAFLLEVAAAPPQLKQSGDLYAKEEARFLEGFDPLPDWLSLIDHAQTGEQRLSTAFRWASLFEFTTATARRGETKVLQLSKAGQRWLMLDRETQFAEVAAVLRGDTKTKVHWGWHDEAFLSSSVQAQVASGKRREGMLSYYQMMSEEDKQPLREALYQLFAELPVGQFFRLKDVLAWASEPVRNPLLLGRSPAEVIVRTDHHALPPVEEAFAEAAPKVLEVIVMNRLARLGCVQLGRDGQGERLLARLPRLDVYFGKAESTPMPVDEATRVLVQPDFTIIVIGLNPAPAASLAPFCERARGSASQGSLTFRLKRESVLRAVAEGMSVSAMLECLERLSSKTLPTNVVAELREWGGLVRKVQVQSAMLFRCPDAATAQRVQGLLGKKAALAGDTMVAWPADEKLTAALRKKLQEQGIMVEVSGRSRSR